MLRVTEEGPSSIQRVISILQALGDGATARPQGIGVVELSRMLGREKSQISRTLKVLADAGLAERDPETRGYRLGWRMITLAAVAGEQRLLAAAPMELRRLVRAAGERAYLTVREGDAALTVLSESPPRLVQTAGWIGHTTPLHCTSSGRVLMFEDSDEEIREICQSGNPAGTRTAYEGPDQVDADAVISLVRQARRRGYAIADEEFEAGAVGAAAPVRDHRGRIVAAVNISAPKFRLRDPRSAARPVVAVAGRLSQALGWEPAALSRRAGQA